MGMYCTKRKEKRGGHVHIVSCGKGMGHVLDREKRKERRVCTYEAVVKGGMYCTDQKMKEMRLCTYEAVVRGGTFITTCITPFHHH